MPSLREARAALTGLGKLLRFDAGFINWFDRGPAGALRAFGLMIPLLPVFLLWLFLQFDASAELSALLIGARIAIYYVLGWVMFPLILIVIGRAVERESQAIGAIGPYIWFSGALSLLVCLLSILGLIGPAGAVLDLLDWPIVIASLVYEAYLLQVLMGIGYLGAGILAVVDYTLGRSLFFLLIVPAIVLPTS
ncbi:hypothetical protein [Dongia sp.]|uniref:hypothetical protein n=1 Tax=Dongia sp. TaxID=1977262 RepID=UPI0035B1B824